MTNTLEKISYYLPNLHPVIQNRLELFLLNDVELSDEQMARLLEIIKDSISGEVRVSLVLDGDKFEKFNAIFKNKNLSEVISFLSNYMEVPAGKMTRCQVISEPEFTPLLVACFKLDTVNY